MAARRENRFVVRSPTAAYLDPAVRQTLADRVTAALDELANCTACPRNCQVNRLANETGVCNTGRYARVSSASPHFGEEDCLRGRRGSGTIFFSLCNLKCVFCQNWDISQRPSGQQLDADRLAAVMLDLQELGCHNINLVTPEHVVPQCVEGLALAIERGLRLPVVYNTSGYDALSSLKLMDGLVDIYMPDFKYWSPQTAKRLSKAEDYPERAREAVHEMHRQVGDLCFTPDGVACRGLLVRHLVMPGLLEETRQIFQWFAEKISRDTFVNIMAQYRPAYKVGSVADTGPQAGTIRYEEINRRLTTEELQAALGAELLVGEDDREIPLDAAWPP